MILKETVGFDGQKVEQTISSFFEVDKFNIRECNNISNDSGYFYPVKLGIKESETYTSIVAITEKFFQFPFEFREVNLMDVEKEILNTLLLKKLLGQKASQIKYLTLISVSFLGVRFEVGWG